MDVVKAVKLLEAYGISENLEHSDPSALPLLHFTIGNKIAGFALCLSSWINMFFFKAFMSNNHFYTLRREDKLEEKN